jgi:hypothetical protein
LETLDVYGNNSATDPAEITPTPPGLETRSDIVQRDDDMWSLGWHDDADVLLRRETSLMPFASGCRNESRHEQEA